MYYTEPLLWDDGPAGPPCMKQQVHIGATGVGEMVAAGNRGMVNMFLKLSHHQVDIKNQWCCQWVYVGLQFKTVPQTNQWPIG